MVLAGSALFFNTARDQAHGGGKGQVSVSYPVLANFLEATLVTNNNILDPFSPHASRFLTSCLDSQLTSAPKHQHEEPR